MLFRRKPKPPQQPPAPPVTQTHQYWGETYQVTQYPDPGRIAVSGHGSTCYIQAENKDNPGFQFAVSVIKEYEQNLFYPPTPITRRAEETIHWENTPERVLQEACRFLRHHHERQLKKWPPPTRPRRRNALTNGLQNAQ